MMSASSCSPPPQILLVSRVLACFKGLDQVRPHGFGAFQADIETDHPLRQAEADRVIGSACLNPRDPCRTDQALMPAPADAELEQLEGVAEGRNVDRGGELDREQAG